MSSDTQGNELDELMKISQGISRAAEKMEKKQQDDAKQREKLQGVQKGLREISISVAVNQLHSVTSPEMVKEVNSLAGQPNNRSLRKLIVKLVHDVEKAVDYPSLTGQRELPIEKQVKTLAILIELYFSLE